MDVISLFPDHPDGLTVKECAGAIGKSEDRSRQILEELVLIKLLTPRKGESKGGSPATVYVPLARFADLLTVPVKPLDHAVDLTGDFTDRTDTLGGEGLSGQSYRESPTAADGGNS
ncbi:MAG: hypothetical protein DMD96_06615 [Candidatus Rokuibacteriota bacterium]|nr:MAG: hypothetical protein DMD96_06615 [Candidatus Rokubacteria bacterium]